MKKHLALYLGLSILLLSSPVWAYSGNYHLERLKIHGEAFLRAFVTVPEEPAEQDPTSLTVEEQLERANDGKTWAQELVVQDVQRLLEVATELSPTMESPNSEAYLQAKASLDSLARRLRVSSAAVEMKADQKLAFDLLMLELDEAKLAMEEGRKQLLAQQQQQRRRSNWSTRIGFGYGWGYPYNYYGPWGYGRRSVFFGRYGYGRYGYGRCR